MFLVCYREGENFMIPTTTTTKTKEDLNQPYGKLSEEKIKAEQSVTCGSYLNTFV